MLPQEIFVLLAPGFEEIEAITIIDVLRRAGLEVRLAAVAPDTRVEGAHGIVVEAEFRLAEAAGAAPGAVVLPGGMPGAQNLKESQEVQELVARVGQAEGLLAAICAAPWALSNLVSLKGRAVTCYPSFRGRLAGGTWQDSPVVVDHGAGTVITSQGPATAMQFALTIVEHFLGSEQRATLEQGLLVSR